MTSIHKCQCGDPICDQYTLSTQRSIGFDLATATKYAAADDLLAALEGVLLWDKDRGFIVPYRVRDPILAAITKARLPG